jgi:hypothetical protein
MRRVCGKAVVGRSIPLRWVLLRGIQHATWNWFYDHEYRTKLIARLASVGNPEACFYARMRTVFVEDRSALMPQLNMLVRSATIGHDVAAFVLSLVLHKSNSGAGNDNIVWWWLRKVEGDEVGPEVNVTSKNEKCTWRLQQAIFVLQDLARRPVRVSLILCLLWPCQCVARMDISAEAEAAASTQDGKVGRSGLCSAARSVGSVMSVIGSSQVCGRFRANIFLNAKW